MDTRHESPRMLLPSQQVDGKVVTPPHRQKITIIPTLNITLNNPLDLTTPMQSTRIISTHKIAITNLTIAIVRHANNGRRKWFWCFESMEYILVDAMAAQWGQKS